MPVMQFCYRCTECAGADTRFKLLKPLQTSLKGFTGLKAHKLATLATQLMVRALSLNVRMVANAHRLDLPHRVSHSVLCFVQLQQAVCLRLVASLSFGMVNMLLTAAELSYYVYAMFV